MSIVNGRKTLLLYIGNFILSLTAALIIIGTIFAIKNLLVSIPYSRLEGLNYLKPQPMDYVWAVHFERESIDINHFARYLNYFQKLVELFPNIKEVDGALGYFSWQIGKRDQAIMYFQNGINRNPNYFWNYYNAAVYYLSKQQYEQAQLVAQQGLRVDPKATIEFLFQSNAIYVPMLEKVKDVGMGPLFDHLKQGYQQLQGIVTNNPNVNPKDVYLF